MVLKMKDVSPIDSSWFCTPDAEKLKYNWFIFEFACDLYFQIKHSKIEALCKWRSRRNNKQLAEFCAYFAKRIRRSTLEVFAEIIDEIEIKDEFVYDYCHTNTASETAAIVSVATDTWKELYEICLVCPSDCTNRYYDKCIFFDSE